MWSFSSFVAFEYFSVKIWKFSFKIWKYSVKIWKFSVISCKTLYCMGFYFLNKSRKKIEGVLNLRIAWLNLPENSKKKRREPKEYQEKTLIYIYRSFGGKEKWNYKEKTYLFHLVRFYLESHLKKVMNPTLLNKPGKKTNKIIFEQ